MLTKYYKFSAVKISKGAVYIGQIDEFNEPNGIGRLIQQDGSIYEGQFVDGEQTGWGREIYAGGRYYIGWWQKGDYHGYGKRYDTDGSIMEQGQFRESKKYSPRWKEHNIKLTSADWRDLSITKSNKDELVILTNNKSLTVNNSQYESEFGKRYKMRSNKKAEQRRTNYSTGIERYKTTYGMGN